MNRSLGLALALLAGTAAPVWAQQTAAPTPAPKPPPQPLPADSLDIARKYANWFLTYQADSLIAHFPAEDKPQPGARVEMDQQMTTFATRAGSETQLLEERWVRRNGRRQYWRKSTYSNAPEPVLLRLVILPDGSLGGIGMSLASQPPPIDPEQ